MAAALNPFGFERVSKNEPADLYIINTCTITHRADSDCRYLIRRAVRANPDARIVVAGCFVDNDPETVAGMEPVDVIIANNQKNAISEILSEKLPELFEVQPATNCSDNVVEFHQHNRAWIKVSDGCNQTCSFCILPRVRGRLVNRSSQEIIDEINGLVTHDYEEVVLTGINIGYYHDKTVARPLDDLADLCRLIMHETDLGRIRISSIEPQTVTDKLLTTLADSGGRICRHWHIPMQSGSSRILRQMRRPYDRDTYMRQVEKAREAVPNTTIGADIIVGFPGETEDDFKCSVELAQSGLVDYLHVFSYSDRPQTDAADRTTDKIKPELIKARNVTLKKISDSLKLQANQRQVGETLEVISEHRSSTDGHLWGVSDNYIRALMPESFESSKQIVRFSVQSADIKGVYGEIVPNGGPPAAHRT